MHWGEQGVQKLCLQNLFQIGAVLQILWSLRGSSKFVPANAKWARCNSCLSLPGEAQALALAIHRWLKPVTLSAEWVFFAAIEVSGADVSEPACLLFTRTLCTTQATGSCIGEGMPSGTGWPHTIGWCPLVNTARHFPSCSEEICSLNFCNNKHSSHRTLYCKLFDVVHSGQHWSPLLNHLL